MASDTIVCTYAYIAKMRQHSALLVHWKSTACVAILMMDTPALLRSYLEIFAEQNQMEVSVVD